MLYKGKPKTRFEFEKILRTCACIKFCCPSFMEVYVPWKGGMGDGWFMDDRHGRHYTAVVTILVDPEDAEKDATPSISCSEIKRGEQ